MGKTITIYDDHRLLPDDPNKWPEQLKAEIRACCCGDKTSTSGSGGGGGTPDIPSGIGCCSGKIINSLKGNIRNTLSHDTGINWHFVPNVTLYPNGNGPEILPPGIPREALPNVPDPNPWLFNPPNNGLPVVYPPAWYSDFYLDYDGGTVSGSTPVQFWGFPVNPPMATFIYNYTFKVYYYAVFGWATGTQLTTLPQCVFTVFQCCYPVGTWTINTPGFWSSGGNWVPPTTFTAPISYHDNYSSPSAFFPNEPPNGNPYGGLGGIIPVNGYFGSTSNYAGWHASSVLRECSSLPLTSFGPYDWFTCNPFLLRGNLNNAFSVESFTTTIVSSQGKPEPYVPYNTNPGGAVAPIIWCPQAVTEPGVNYIPNNGVYVPGKATIEAFE